MGIIRAESITHITGMFQLISWGQAGTCRCVDSMLFQGDTFWIKSDSTFFPVTELICLPVRNHFVHLEMNKGESFLIIEYDWFCLIHKIWTEKFTSFYRFRLIRSMHTVSLESPSGPSLKSHFEQFRDQPATILGLKAILFIVKTN